MSRRIFYRGVIVALGLFFVSSWQIRAASPQKGSLPPEDTIRAEGLLQQIRILAAPEMEGRASGTPGGARAAAHIAQEFRKAGLKPLGQSRGYLQPFEITTGIKLGSENHLALQRAQERKLYKAGISFNPFGFSDEGKLSGEVVFAGYGITAPEFQYDDYAGVDVKDKIVLVMTHEPQEKNREGPFRKAEAFRYTEVRTKVINAREHGAKAIIVVTDPINHEREELFAIRGGGSASAGIIAVNALREIAETILSSIGKKLSELQREIDETFAPRSFLIPGVVAHLEVSLVREKGHAANVIGMLPGRDPRLREEAIVIGAHYDGLGRGGESSLAPDRYGEIHPGADDNASGVSGVVALAKAFTRSGAKRTIVFVAFAAEEMGLLGSSYYVKNPLWPIDKSYAMINLDGIGRLESDRLYLLGVDSAKEFRALIQEAANDLRLQLNMRGDGFGPSDHTPFYARERPVVMLFTGPHSDYHRPSDTPEKINGDGLEKIVKLAFRIAARLADRPGSLTFVKMKAQASRVAREERGGYGAYFGSIPDFPESALPGVRLGGVRPGSPAEKAGLKAGDIITKFAGVTIRNLEDLAFALRSKRPGDQVEVLYLRDGKELKAQGTLEQRR